MVEILLWVAVVLLIVLVVWVLRQRPVSFREDAERIERTVREENRTARDESAGTLSRFQTELKDDMARQDSRSTRTSRCSSSRSANGWTRWRSFSRNRTKP